METTDEGAAKMMGGSNRYILAVIADYETVIGFLLAGIGEYIDSIKSPNYMVASQETTADEIAAFYRRMCDSKTVAVILIGTEIYTILKQTVQLRESQLPLIVELPSKKSLQITKGPDDIA